MFVDLRRIERTSATTKENVDCRKMLLKYSNFYFTVAGIIITFNVFRFLVSFFNAIKFKSFNFENEKTYILDLKDESTDGKTTVSNTFVFYLIRR